MKTNAPGIVYKGAPYGDREKSDGQSSPLRFLEMFAPQESVVENEPFRPNRKVLTLSKMAAALSHGARASHWKINTVI